MRPKSLGVFVLIFFLQSAFVCEVLCFNALLLRFWTRFHSVPSFFCSFVPVRDGVGETGVEGVFTDL